MKDIENIEDWYREELNNYNVEPEGDVWNSLSDELDADMTLTDDNISDWYKREVNKLEERPDYTVWEKLATKLDTTTVWDKLVVSLNRYDQMIWWRNTIIKGSAILLLLIGSYEVYDRYIATESNAAFSTSEANGINQTNSISNEQPGATGVDVEANSTSPKEIISTVAGINESYGNQATKGTSLKERNNTVDNNTSAKSLERLTNSKKSSGEEKDHSQSSINKFTPKQFSKESLLAENGSSRAISLGNRREITEEDISHTFSASDFLVKKEKDKIVFNSKRFSSHFTYGLYARRFYLGLNMGVKKQGMISQMNKSGILANTNQTEYLDFGYNFGITGGYILSDNVNLESTVNVISTSGYERKFSEEGYSTREELDLNYTSINLLAKKMNTKSTFDNKVYATNFIGGIYASYLQSGASSINDNLELNKLDYGIVLGIEQDRYLSKTLIITPGFRYNQGLANVFANDNAFNYGYNFSLEFNLGIKYIFLKKSK